VRAVLVAVAVQLFSVLQPCDEDQYQGECAAEYGDHPGRHDGVPSSINGQPNPTIDGNRKSYAVSKGIDDSNGRRRPLVLCQIAA
jgi:hypothetical protein